MRPWLYNRRLRGTPPPGAIAPTGLLTAPGTPVANATVTASSGTVSGTARFSASSRAPTVAVAAAVSSNPVTGTTCNLSVLGADSAGESTLTYTWSTTGTPPAAVVHANGSNASKDTTATFTAAGSYSFQVTIADPTGAIATSSVNVTVNQTLTAITVSPPSTTLGIGGTQQYTAAAEDQFGAALATQPTFTSDATAGTITPTGLLTAPATSSAGVSGGTVSRSGTVSGTAPFTLTNVATPLDRLRQPRHEVHYAGPIVRFHRAYQHFGNADNPLTGLGLRRFPYDSQVLTFNSFSDVLQTGLFQEQTQPTAVGPSTEKYVQIAWADITGNWPNAILPVNLLVLNFTLAAGT